MERTLNRLQRGNEAVSKKTNLLVLSWLAIAFALPEVENEEGRVQIDMIERIQSYSSAKRELYLKGLQYPKWKKQYSRTRLFLELLEAEASSTKSMS